MTGMVADLEQCETAPDWLLTVAQQAFTAHTPKSELMAYLGKVLREDPVSVAFAMKKILLGQDLHPTMRRIWNVPILIIAGEQDHVLDVAQRRALRLLSRAATSSSCRRRGMWRSGRIQKG